MLYACSNLISTLPSHSSVEDIQHDCQSGKLDALHSAESGGAQAYIDWQNFCNSMARSYQPDSSRSRPITEDKLAWDRIVVR